MGKKWVELSTHAPIFGLLCFESKGRWLAAYCGGGGSSKTGVGNQIAVVEINEDDTLKTVTTLDTGDELGAAMCRVGEYLVVCFGKKFQGFQFVNDTLTPVTDQIVADFHDTEPCLNGCGGAPDGLDAITGGDDARARIWTLSDACEAKVRPEMRVELQGHTAPVTDAKFSRFGVFCCTASKDGTCRVWSAGSGELYCACDAAKVAPPIALKPPVQKKKRPGPPLKIMCRAARFSEFDDAVSVVSSTSRGAAYVAKFRLSGAAGEKNDGPVLDHIQVVADTPVSAVADNGTLLGLGDVLGSVNFADAESLETVFSSRRKPKIHELPVTACSFANHKLLTASADYKLALIPAPIPPSRRRPNTSFWCKAACYLLLFTSLLAASVFFYVAQTHRLVLLPKCDTLPPDTPLQCWVPPLEAQVQDTPPTAPASGTPPDDDDEDELSASQDAVDEPPLSSSTQDPADEPPETLESEPPSEQDPVAPARVVDEPLSEEEPPPDTPDQFVEPPPDLPDDQPPSEEPQPPAQADEADDFFEPPLDDPPPVETAAPEEEEFVEAPPSDYVAEEEPPPPPPHDEF